MQANQALNTQYFEDLFIFFKGYYMLHKIVKGPLHQYAVLLILGLALTVWTNNNSETSISSLNNQIVNDMANARKIIHNPLILSNCTTTVTDDNCLFKLLTPDIGVASGFANNIWSHLSVAQNSRGVQISYTINNPARAQSTDITNFYIEQVNPPQGWLLSIPTAGDCPTSRSSAKTLIRGDSCNIRFDPETRVPMTILPNQFSITLHGDSLTDLSGINRAITIRTPEVLITN